MKRILATALLLFTLGIIPSLAQYVDVIVYEQEGTSPRMPKTGVHIWTFLSQNDANRAKAKLKAGGEVTLADGMQDHKLSESSPVQMRGRTDGYILFDDGFSLIEVISCKRFLNRKREGGEAVEYVITRKKHSGDDSNDAIELKGVEKSAQRTMRKAKAGTANACRNRLIFSRQLYLDDLTLNRTDARYVVAPVLIRENLGQWDTIAYMKPVVLDGNEYHRTNHRRMGYEHARQDGQELDQEKHDKLGPYVLQLHYMETRQPDSLIVSGVYDQYDESRKYKMMGHAWFEDYNTVYHEQDIVLWNGRVQRPQRYLDWSVATVEVGISPERYLREERKEATNYTDELHLQFEVGKSTLDQSDSLTMQQLDDICRKLNAITSNSESQLQKVVIKGYSSPEGSHSLNRRLSHERASHMISVLNNRVHGNKPAIRAEFDNNDNIASWEEAAEVLEAMQDTLAHKYAAEIRNIVARSRNIDEQSRQITRQPWYTYVKENALPQLRRVIIEYSSFEFRVIPAEETYERYLKGEEGYIDGTRLKGYQFYGLMNRLRKEEDWEGLERIARAAYKSSDEDVKEVAWRFTRGNAIVENGDTVRDSNGEPLYSMIQSRDFYRPYPLAAYYLTECLIRKKQVDTKLLEPYIDDSAGGLENQKRDRSGQLREWWNDPSIVINQIMMYCLDNDFEKASYIAANHLPEEEQYRTLRMMLRAMNCEWDNPEVRDAVAATTPMNAVAMYIAMDDKPYYRKALDLLTDSIGTGADNVNPLVPYLVAICRFHLECLTSDYDDVTHYASPNIYVPEAEQLRAEGEVLYDWAAPMLDAFRMDPQNAEFLQGDGYFNDAYRGLVLFFWKRLKDGLTIDQIAKEYDYLVSKYNE